MLGKFPTFTESVVLRSDQDLPRFPDTGWVAWKNVPDTGWVACQKVPVTANGLVSFESMLDRDAFPAVCSAEVDAPVGIHRDRIGDVDLG